MTSVHDPCDIRIFRKEARSLAAHGWDVLVAATGEAAEDDGPVRLKLTPGRRGRIRRMTLSVLDVYRSATQERADIYHIHDPELLPVGLFLALRGRIVIYDAHEDLPRAIMSKRWVARPLRGIVARVTEAIENAIVRRLAGVVAATPAIGQRFQSIARRTVVVSNFPMLEEFGDALVWAPERKERAVCYVGGITRQRGAAEMITAAGSSDTVLYMAGEFRPASLRAEAESLAGWKNVRALGFLERRAAIDVMHRSMAGLVLFHPEPNHVDAQPNKIFEYMAAGLPVIGADFPLWRKVIEENGCGICANPLDPKAIADAIRRILDDPEKAREMGARGRRAVEQRYSWESEAATLVAFYDGLMSQSNRGAQV